MMARRKKTMEARGSCSADCRPGHIKHVNSSVSDRWAIYRRSDWRGCELPSRYGALGEK